MLRKLKTTEKLEEKYSLVFDIHILCLAELIFDFIVIL